MVYAAMDRSPDMCTAFASVGRRCGCRTRALPPRSKRRAARALVQDGKAARSERGSHGLARRAPESLYDVFFMKHGAQCEFSTYAVRKVQRPSTKDGDSRAIDHARVRDPRSGARTLGHTRGGRATKNHGAVLRVRRGGVEPRSRRSRRCESGGTRIHP